MTTDDHRAAFERLKAVTDRAADNNYHKFDDDFDDAVDDLVAATFRLYGETDRRFE